MNLQERSDECHRLARLADDAIDLLPVRPSAAGVLSAAASLQDYAGMWTGEHLRRPAGSPSGVQRSADAYGRIAADLTARRSTLDAQASAVERGFDADTGRAVAGRVRAFRDLVELERQGAVLVRDALAAYADGLDDGQTRYDRHASDVRSARSDAFAIEAPPDYDADWTDAECRAAIDRIRGVYVDARAALSGCGGAFDSVVDAERRLDYALSDAAGYARLSGLPTSGGAGLVDAVLAVAAGVGDPDRAIVSDAEWAAYLAARDGLDAGERRQLDDALDRARTPEERQIIVSALSTGAGLALTLALAGKLRTMSSAQVSAVAGLGMQEVRDGVATISTPDGTTVLQQTGTTCGSSSLLMLAAQRDPFLALLLAEGEFVDGHVPEYVSDLPLIEHLPDAGLTAEERLRHVQEEIRKQTNRDTFWPGSMFGSAPWGYGDEVERITGGEVDMEYSMLTPHDDARSLVDRAVAAVDGGTPVPFLVGDGEGVPRHYVLLVGHQGDELQFYEPGSGKVLSVPLDDAVAGEKGAEAFGWWSSIYGAALPAG